MSDLENRLLYPLDLFKYEVNSIDEKIKINAIKKISTIALALGPEKTRDELIPFLKGYISEITCYEELQLNLAKQLGDFVQYIGDSAYGILLFDILEELAASDEISVCDQSVQSLCKIADGLVDGILENEYISLIKRLTKKDWFTTRRAALGLFKACYKRVSLKTKEDLRSYYLDLCKDESPMVRRNAALNFSQFVALIEKNELMEQFLPVFLQFSKDDQDSVKELSVNIIVAIGPRLTENEKQEYLVETIELLARDMSWKIRNQVASLITELQEALGSDITRKNLVVIFKELSRDNENNIREVIAHKVVTFCENLRKTYEDDDNIDPVIKDDILPIITDLNEDYSEIVREGLSMVITGMSQILGSDGTREFLLPLVMSTIKNNYVTIKEHYLQNLNTIISIIGFDNLGEVVEEIMQELLSKSTSLWRTRRSLVVTIYNIAKITDETYFTKSVLPYYHKLLSDPVYSVRKTAPIILPILIKRFGMSWAKSNLLFSVFNYSNHTHYLYRYICLFCIDEMVEPTIQTNMSYLNNLNKSSLYKISHLNGLLKEALNSKWVHENNKISTYTSFNDDIKTYAEDTLEKFTENNILSVTEDEAKGAETYLESLLILLLRYALEIIKNLNADIIENVKLRSVHTLQKIITLQNKLQQEINASEISIILQSISAEDVLLFNQEIDDKLNSGEEFMEQEVTQVDHGTKFERRFFNSVDSLASTQSSDNPFMDARSELFVESSIEYGVEERLISNGRDLNTIENEAACSLETEILDILDHKLSISKDDLASIDV